MFPISASVDYVNCFQRYLLVRPSNWNLNPGPAATTARQRRYTSYNGTPFLAVHLLLFARVYDDYYVITGVFTPLVNAISLPPPQPRYALGLITKPFPYISLQSLQTNFL